MQSPGILCDKPGRDYVELPFKHGFLWELQLSLYQIFTAQLALFFSFTVIFNSREIYIFRRLVCIAFSQIQALILCFGR